VNKGHKTKFENSKLEILNFQSECKNAIAKTHEPTQIIARIGIEVIEKRRFVSAFIVHT